MRNAKQLIKKGRFIACKIYIVTNVCLIYSTTLYHRFIYEKLFYALHEYLFVSYGVGVGDKRMLKFPAKTKMTMGSINK